VMQERARRYAKTVEERRQLPLYMRRKVLVARGRLA